ncbi:transposable element Tcb2 transposase [Trichonephila clavipes]|nr:transposable element Tcb2 transposase [Trichonephila clavipes]
MCRRLHERDLYAIRPAIWVSFMSRHRRQERLQCAPQHGHWICYRIVVLGPVDSRDVIYTKDLGRLRTPSTDQSSRRPPHHKKCMRTANSFIGRHSGTGSTFTRYPCDESVRNLSTNILRRLFGDDYKFAYISNQLQKANGICKVDRGVPTPCVGTPVSSRTIRRHLAEGHLGSWCPLRVLPFTPTHRSLEWCSARGNWTVVEWTPLVLIQDTVTAQWYVHDILVPHALPLMQRLPGAIFQQVNARPLMARVSQDYLRTVTTLPWSARSTEFSPIEHIRDRLG